MPQKRGTKLNKFKEKQIRDTQILGDGVIALPSFKFVHVRIWVLCNFIIIILFLFFERIGKTRQKNQKDRK